MKSGALSWSVVTLAAALSGGLVGSVLTYWNTDRQIDVKMIEIAVGILSQEPTDNIAPARIWAVDLVSHYSEVKLTEEVRTALIENRAIIGPYDLGGGWDTYGYNSENPPPDR